MNNKINFLPIIVLIPFFISCKKGGNSEGNDLSAPSIDKVVFSSANNAAVHMKSSTGNFEVSFRAYNGFENFKSGNSPVAISVPAGEVIDIKARAVSGSSKSDFSSSVKVLASGRTDKGFNRLELIEKINKIRTEGFTCDGVAKPAVSKITWDDKLEGLSLSHANDMSENKFLSGTGSDGKTFKQRLEAGGFTCQSYREILMQGPSTAENFYNSIITNSTACNAFMSSTYKYISGAYEGGYWAVDLTE